MELIKFKWDQLDHPLYSSDILPYDFHLFGILKKTSEREAPPLGDELKDAGELDLVTRFVEWAQNEIAVVPDFHKRILISDEVHFWLNGYVNKQNCLIWSEAKTQVYVETPLHPEKRTVWCALWAGGILLQKR
ncbi:hypothetical protein TNCV_999331 [Trichonephila clavipes]|nr:hypothetical protein TNCV_999331 [Trichonephila clavipes]